MNPRSDRRTPSGTAGPPGMRAWSPDVPGIVEVFHAQFVNHVYPAHTHDVWTLLIVDDGGIRFDLDHRHHGAMGRSVVLLPPDVPHDGQAATPNGFRKRVLYIDTSVIGSRLVGAAVDSPRFDDYALRQRIHQLHVSLARPGEEFEAECRLTFVRERLGRHLRDAAGLQTEADGQPGLRPEGRLRGRGPAGDLRELLDAHLTTGIALGEAARRLHAHPTHLVRSFTKTFGLPPHSYLTGRRIDLARRLLLTGQSVAAVATEVGFYDQSHLTRHFKRYLGVSPGRYAVNGGTR